VISTNTKYIIFICLTEDMNSGELMPIVIEYMNTSIMLGCINNLLNLMDQSWSTESCQGTISSLLIH